MMSLFVVTMPRMPRKLVLHGTVYAPPRSVPALSTNCVAREEVELDQAVQRDGGPQHEHAGDDDREEVGQDDGLVGALDLAGDERDAVAVGEEPRAGDHDAEGVEPVPRGRHGAAGLFAGGRKEAGVVDRAVGGGGGVPALDEPGLAELERVVADGAEQDGAAADAEDHDDLLDAREPLDAEHHEQERDDVGDGRDDERAPRVAEAPEELLGLGVVEPRPVHELGHHDHAGVGRPGRQHVDPHDPHEGVAERLADAHDGVDDARVVDVLAARPGHGAAEHAPDDREADAGEDHRDDRRPDEVAAEVDADAEAGHDPDRRREPLVHEADAEGVPHGEAADEAAGFAGKG